jgi:hypothetical protein
MTSASAKDALERTYAGWLPPIGGSASPLLPQALRRRNEKHEQEKLPEGKRIRRTDFFNTNGIFRQLPRDAGPTERRHQSAPPF